ncbi:ANTAR domain-containing protein [Rhodococcus sp. B10]|uniref:ANTAR domain-containing protein n=1 Tax=Rhodococcus sp. B10 TaxID=2695876 RepID=UPI001430A5B6|nr:ANTAR domain-containing protein [Rhodococcus sp. B10]
MRDVPVVTFPPTIALLSREIIPANEVDVTSTFAVKTPRPLEPVGKFSFSLADERWHWSPDVAALHGYPAQEMAPTTATVLSHVHHADRGHAFGVMAKMAESTTPTSRKIRILDTRGHCRHVVLLGSRAAGSTAHDLKTSGLYIDITETYDHDVELAVAERGHSAGTTQPRIDRATGMLMLIYGISADRALNLLMWRSHDTGTEISLIATRLLDAVGECGMAEPPLRERFDHLLLTAHTPRPSLMDKPTTVPTIERPIALADRMPGLSLRKPTQSLKEKRAEKRAKALDDASTTRKRKR